MSLQKTWGNIHLTALGAMMLSFLLGVCVTVLLYRLRGADERRRQDEPDDED